MVIYDTNVVSELMRTKPYERVQQFLRRFESATSFITATTVQELWYGVLAVKDSEKKARLEASLVTMLVSQFRGRVLDFDSKAAKVSAELLLVQLSRGHQIQHWDTQIAAIAITSNFTLLTRNTKDFNYPGLQLSNPWTD